MTEPKVIVVGHLYDNPHLKGLTLWLCYESGELVLSNSVMSADEFTPLEAYNLTRQYETQYNCNVHWTYLELRPRNVASPPPNIQRLVFPE